MGKFNKKIKGKEKREREEFNPSARDPYIGKKKKNERTLPTYEDLAFEEEDKEYLDEDSEEEDL